METFYFVLRCLDWISVNSKALIEILNALAPLTALLVVGYTVHVIKNKLGKK